MFDAQQENIQKRYALLWVFVICVFLVRLFVVFFSGIPLGVDEIQYAVWSKHVAWGYHSKPPFIAWVIASSTALIHGYPLAQVRLFSPVCYLITSILLYATAKRLFCREVAAWVLFSFTVLLAVSFGALLMSTDALLLMFWSLALYLCVRVLEKSSVFNWVILGIAIGVGSLAKYTALIFWVSLIVFFIIQSDKRYLLKSPYLYLSILISAAVLLPNILWNAQHHFASLGHLLHHNVNITGPSSHLGRLFNFLFSQLGVFSPIFFPLLIWLLFRKSYVNQDWRFNFLRCFSLIMLVAICIEALLARAYANWAVVAYASGIIVVVHYLVTSKQQVWLKINAYAMVLVMCVVYIAILAVGINHLPHKWVPKTLRRSHAWKLFGHDVAMLHQIYPHAKFIFNDRKYWAPIVYYSGIPYNQILAYDNAFDFAADTVASFLNYHVDSYIQLSPHTDIANTMKLLKIHYIDGRFWAVSTYHWMDYPTEFVTEYHPLFAGPSYYVSGYDNTTFQSFYSFYRLSLSHLYMTAPLTQRSLLHEVPLHQQYIYITDRMYPELSLPLSFHIEPLNNMLPNLPHSEVINAYLLKPKEL